MVARFLLVGLLLVGCGVDEAVEQKNLELKAAVESLKGEIAQKEARNKALMVQLEDEAAQKVALMKDIERMKPMVERVEAAERRVEEVEEMIKERKKLE